MSVGARLDQGSLALIVVGIQSGRCGLSLQACILDGEGPSLSNAIDIIVHP